MSRRILLGVALLASASGSAGAEEAIYFVATDIRLPDAAFGALQERSFTGIRTEGAIGGERRLQTRVLWSEQRGTGFSANSLRLDPTAPDDGAILRLLDTGFEMTLAADGSVRELHAVDPLAWQHAVKRAPQLAAQMAAQRRFGGLIPTGLPATLRIGQVIVRHDHSDDMGSITAHEEVLALTDTEVLLDVVVTGTQVSGKGRQVLQRNDGMPVEARFALSTHEHGDNPAMEMNLYVARMSAAPLFDADDREFRQRYEALAREQFERPPFSSPSTDPAVYSQDAATLIPPGMLDGRALAELEAGLVFSVNEDHYAARPLIRIGVPFPEDEGTASGDEWFPLMAWLRQVCLLDDQGQPLPRLLPVPVVQRWLVAGASRASENDVGFPFRLPINTGSDQLDRLSTIRLAVDVERYTIDAEERVPRGQQSQGNALAQITWGSDRRATLVQPVPGNTEREGVWTTAVALDARGKKIPIALVYGRRNSVDADAAFDHREALEWERDREPQHLEIAAAAPIHALQLRHYRWQRVPRDWVFRKTQGHSN